MKMDWVEINDYRFPAGWAGEVSAGERALEYCRRLEAGEILFFGSIPFDLREEEKEFLLAQRQTGSRLHKNISYRPQQDILKGLAADGSAEVSRMQEIMRRYSQEVTQFLSSFLTPYAG